MAPRVYSTVFIDETSVGEEGVTYTVPAGYRAVVRDIVGTVYGAGAGGGVTGFTGESATFLLLKTPPNTEQPYHWRGRMVLNAGDNMFIGGVASETDVVASGYLFVDDGSGP